MSSILRLDRLRQFIGELATLLDSRPDESTLLAQAHPLLAELVRQDDWLPEDCARPDPQRYQQYLLHVDSRQRFSVVSFVWGAGPDHTGTRSSGLGPDRHAPRGRILAAVRLRCGGRPHPSGARRRLEPGEVEALSPRIGDVHQVSNAFSDRTSISIHVYGANIGAVRRAVFSAEGEEKPFISGYSNSRLPNIWDLSKENPA